MCGGESPCSRTSNLKRPYTPAYTHIHTPIYTHIHTLTPPPQTLRPVGKFKGLVRVTVEHPSASPMIPKDVLDLLLKPRPYKVRLYVLRASGLAKMDRNVDFSLAARCVPVWLTIFYALYYLLVLMFCEG